MRVRHYNGTAIRVVHGPGVGQSTLPPASPWDWSDDLLPWAYPADPVERRALFTADWEPDVQIIPLNTSLGATFWDQLFNTVQAHGGRPVVYLPEGVYQLTAFKPIPYDGSGSVNYAAAFWHTKLRGLLGDGADKTIIEIAPGSMSQAQLDDLATRSADSFAVSHLMGIRIDTAKGASKAHISGVGFRAHDQNMVQTLHSSVLARGVAVPTPAPHSGMSIFGGDWATRSPARALISFCRFQGFGRALLSLPPFEHSNLSSQYGVIDIHHTESDGRRAKEIDPAQTRACGTIMANNEERHTLRDSWFHHNRLSRYAVNDQNYDTYGTYEAIRTKLHDITNVPVPAGSNPCLMGWETTAAKINLIDAHLTVDNPSVQVATQQHLGFTVVSGGNHRDMPANVGPLVVRGGTFRNLAWPQLDGMLSIRLKPENQAGGSPWYYNRDEVIFVYDDNGNRKQAWEYTGAWPPTAAQIAAAGVSPETHYLVRPTNV